MSLTGCFFSKKPAPVVAKKAKRYKIEQDLGPHHTEKLPDFSKIPNGGPGVENRMSLIFNGGVKEGRIGLNRFVEITSTAAAKLFGLFPRKGTIAPGSDADIVVFDPDKKFVISAKTHHMRVDYNCYEGMEVQGAAEVVISRGKVVVDRGQYLGKPGDGQFLRRSTTQHHVKESATRRLHRYAD